MGAQQDVIIVGAGPAGLSCAIGLRRLGREVLVLDRGSGPQDKACGEGIMPDGLLHLAALGIDAAALGGFILRGVRYIDPAVALQLTWHNTFALGLRRTSLSQILRQGAEDAGVRFKTAQVRRVKDGKSHAWVTTDDQSIKACLVVGADGLHSGVRRSLTQSSRPAKTSFDRFGLRQHFALAPWTNHVEVHLAKHAEAYVTPVAPDEVGVAILTHTPMRGHHLPLEDFPALKARLEGVPKRSSLRGAGPLAQHASTLAGHRVALIGDAGGYCDAATGEGISLALAESALLCQLVSRHLPLHHLNELHRHLTRRYRLSTRALVWLGYHPRLRRLLLWVARLMPGPSARFAQFMTRHPDVTRHIEQAS